MRAEKLFNDAQESARELQTSKKPNSVADRASWALKEKSWALSDVSLALPRIKFINCCAMESIPPSKRRVEIARAGGLGKAQKYVEIKEFVFNYYHQSGETSVPKVAASMEGDLKEFCASIGKSTVLAPSNIEKTVIKWLYQHRKGCSVCNNNALLLKQRPNPLPAG